MDMNQDFWIKELARLFKRSHEAIEKGDKGAVSTYSREFNDTLKKLKQNYPNNPIITSTDPVESTYMSPDGFIWSPHEGAQVPPSTPKINTSALYEIRSNCERIANSLEYELPDVDTQSGVESLTVFSIDNRQSTSQTVSNSIDVTSIYSTIDNSTHNEKQKEELRNAVSEVEAELNKNQPDESKISQLIDNVKDQSPIVAAELISLCATEGLPKLVSQLL